MTIEIPENKRCIVAYTDGEAKALRQRYILANYPANPDILVDDINNLLDHYFEHSEAILPPRTKEEITEEIDGLLEELKALEISTAIKKINK